MKKVLFATTALIATSGMAAAEISFGGFGRFGLLYTEGTADETRVEQRFRLTITGTTTSDNGLDFEGRIRFQTDDTATGAATIAQRSAAGFAVSTGGFRLDVGHVSDVLDSGDVVNYYGYGVGLTSFGEQSSNFGLPASGFGTSPDDTTIAPTVKLRYTFGDFTASVSFTDDASTVQPANVGSTAVTTTSTVGEEYQIGIGYSFGNYSVGALWGNADTTVTTTTTPFGGTPTVVSTTTDNDFWAISFGGEIGAFAFSILVGDDDSGADTGYGFSVKYDVGAATEIRFAYSNDRDVVGQDDVVAIGFRHSLGGGVSLQGGVGQNSSGNTIADLGVIFNF